MRQIGFVISLMVLSLTPSFANAKSFIGYCYSIEPLGDRQRDGDKVLIRYSRMFVVDGSKINWDEVEQPSGSNWTENPKTLHHKFCKSINCLRWKNPDRSNGSCRLQEIVLPEFPEDDRYNWHARQIQRGDQHPPTQGAGSTFLVDWLPEGARATKRQPWPDK
jgi:hypothetical protein